MNKEIKFTVDADPSPQPRQRHRIVKAKGKDPYVQNYTPKNAYVQTFKFLARMAARRAHQGPPLEGPLRCDVVYVMPRPANKFWKTKPMPRLWHITTPDRDNLDKALMDALTGIVWIDDAQVCDGRIQKWIAAGDERAHVEVTISSLLPRLF